MILVTGHKGFIGRNLVKHLEQQGNEVYGFDAVDGDPIELAKQVPWDKITMIYHQGAISNTTELDVLKVQRWNVQSSVEIFQKAIQHGIPVHYASSGSVYGQSMAVNKTYDYNPLNYYAVSKYTVDLWVMENRSSFTAPITGYRYFNVYGADEKKSDFCTSPVYRFSEQAKNDGVIKIFKGSENTYRDFVWVGDIIKIITTNAQEGIFDLGCSHPISFLDVAVIVADKYNVPVKFIDMPEIIKGKYQTYSCARRVFDHKFMMVEDFVNKYMYAE
jgi:ADP-L-glycero-D-manno-heptose 6-epimerase